MRDKSSKRASSKAAATAERSGSAETQVPSTTCSTTRASRWREFLATLGPWLLLTALPIVIYANALDAPFIFDDEGSVCQNPSLARLTDLPRIWRGMGRGETVQGRPLLNFTFALDHAVHGGSPVGFRITNVAIHCLNGMLVFLLVRETLQHGDQGRPLMENAAGVALASAAMWVAHPLQTESVTYIVQRAESLATFHWLATLLCFATWLRTRRGSLWVAIVLFSLAGMISKEIAITAPFVALVYDRVFYAESWREIAQRRLAAHATLWATTLLLFAILMADSGTRAGSAGFGSGVSSWQYLLTSIDATATYLKLSFWPHPLVLDYGEDVVVDPRTILPQAALVLGGATAALIAGRRWPWIAFLAIAFAATLSPASSVVPVVTQTRAEHRMYLPLLALVVFVVVLASLAAHAVKRPALFSFLAIAATIALAAVAVDRNRDYQDVYRMWLDVARKRPGNARAVTSLGDALRVHGLDRVTAQDRAALAAIEDQIRARGDSASLQIALARLKTQLGDLEAGLELCESAQRIDDRRFASMPTTSRSFVLNDEISAFIHTPSCAEKPCSCRTGYFATQKGAILARMGRHPEAVAAFDTAIAPRGWFPDAVSLRAKSLFALGRKGDAFRDFQTCVEREPDDASHRDNLAAAFANEGQLERALDCSNEAIARNTYDPLYRARRGRILAALGRNREALSDFDFALRANPRNLPSLDGRAKARFAVGDFAGCLNDLEKLAALGGAVSEDLLRRARARIAGSTAD